MIRTRFNTVKLIGRELADPNLKVKAIGMRRALGLLAVMASTPIAVAFSKWYHGIDDDDEERMRDLSAPWETNAQFIYTGKDESGSGVHPRINISNTDPDAVFRDAITAIMREEEWEDGLWEGTKELLGPFYGREILAGKLLDVFGTDQRVYNEEEPMGWMKAIPHVGEAFVPGSVTSGLRVYKGAVGESSDYGKAYDLEHEIIANVTGLRMADLDAHTAFSHRVGKYVRSNRKAEQILNSVATRGRKVTDEELTEAYHTMEIARRGLFKIFVKNIESANGLNVSLRDIEDKMRTFGLSGPDTAILLSGQYKPFSPTNRWLSSQPKKAKHKGLVATEADYKHRRELIQKLAIEASDNPAAARRELNDAIDKQINSHITTLHRHEPQKIKGGNRDKYRKRLKKWQDDTQASMDWLNANGIKDIRSRSKRISAAYRSPETEKPLSKSAQKSRVIGLQKNLDRLR